MTDSACPPVPRDPPAAVAPSAPDLRRDLFPHDRVVLFSDAVFAIAMTLLVIEIKVPGHAQVAAGGMGNAMAALIPLFIGYVVSFLVLSLFWVGHLQTWKYVTHVPAGLVWLNAFELMFVALMPFTTGLYTEYVGSNVVFAFYCANLAAIALFAYLQRALVIRREGLVEKLGRHHVAWLRARTLIALAVFMACAALAPVAPWLARWLFVLIFVLHPLARRMYHARAQAEARPA